MLLLLLLICCCCYYQLLLLSLLLLLQLLFHCYCCFVADVVSLLLSNSIATDALTIAVLALLSLLLLPLLCCWCYSCYLYCCCFTIAALHSCCWCYHNWSCFILLLILLCCWWFLVASVTFHYCCYYFGHCCYCQYAVSVANTTDIALLLPLFLIDAAISSTFTAANTSATKAIGTITPAEFTTAFNYWQHCHAAAFLFRCSC